MEKREFMISGLSLIGDQTGRVKGAAFRAVNPANAAELEPVFYSATGEDIDQAASLAEAAFPAVAGLSGRERAVLLRRIAMGLRVRLLPSSSARTWRAACHCRVCRGNSAEPPGNSDSLRKFLRRVPG